MTGRPGTTTGENMAWAVLIVSGLLEAGWALSLKASEGFTRLGPTIAFGVLLVLSMAGLGWALRTLPVGVAYAVWTGVGAVVTAVAGMLWLDELVSVGKIVSILLIVAGIVGLHLFGGDEAAAAAGGGGDVTASDVTTVAE
ncbi:multidrug efflux SMR transporter [Cellulomonas sp. APG4]|uniref:DMT family transporter n=1 Tax=Cellulomonas sp. APG4 TaxID=1538656 RepID=UPI00351AF5FD